MTPKVSVVIPVYNNADVIGAQLDGLHAALEIAPETEILIVDNGSTDGLASVVDAWVEQSGTPIAVVPATEKQGEPHARNVGVRVSRGDYVLFCDGDDIVRPTWIAALAEALDFASFATGPVHTDLLNEPGLANVRGTAVFEGRPMLYGTVPFAHGCNMGFRRELFDEIGLFDESFLAGCDQEIAIRAWRAGHDLVFAEDAVVDYRLRPDLASNWRQGRSYGRYRVFVRRLISSDIDLAAQRRANLRRVGWLLKHLPGLARDREQRARWVWVAAQLVGEAHGTWEAQRGR